MLSNEGSQRARLPEAAQAPGLTRQAFLLRGAGGLVAFSSLSAALAACGSGGSAAGTAPGAAVGNAPATPTGSLRVAMPGFPVSLDPTVDGAVSTVSVLAQVYETLVGFNHDYTQLVGVLATRWAASSDGRTWTFTLRQGVRFHDGTAFDASVARKSLEYMLRRDSPFGALLGVPTIDDPQPDTLVLHYRDPFPDCARNLTYAGPMFSPKLLVGGSAAAEKRIDKQHAGTGPYRFASVSNGQSIELTAFDGYWGSKRHVKTITFDNIPDESQRNSALEAGDVDLVMQVAPLAAQSQRANARLKVQSVPTWTTVTLQPVCTLKPFDDVRARQAMMYALDRRTLIEKLLLGQAQFDSSMLPQGVYGYAPAQTVYDHDPAKARALLKAAGYDGSPIRLSTRSDAVLASEISQALAAQLSAGGFNVTADVLDPAAYEADKYVPKPRYQLHWEEWGWVNGGPLHITLGTIAVVAKYSSPAYDALVAKITSTPDGPARLRSIQQAVEIWARDAVWATLWTPNRIDTTAADVQGYQPPPNVITLLGNTYRSGA